MRSAYRISKIVHWKLNVFEAKQYIVNCEKHKVLEKQYRNANKLATHLWAPSTWYCEPALEWQNHSTRANNTINLKAHTQNTGSAWVG